MTRLRPKLGLLAERAEDLENLAAVLTGARFDIAYAGLVQDTPALPAEPQLWLLRLAHCSADCKALIDAIVKRDAPMVVEEEGLDTPLSSAYYESIIDKTYADHLARAGGNAAKYVWVLAASAGGPEAVIEFLSALDELARDQNNSGGDTAYADDAAFIYAQHIDEASLDNLSACIQRNTALNVQGCDHGARIQAKSLYIVPPHSQVLISDSKRFRVTGEAWRGDYAPSINQVIGRVAKLYKEQAGAIVFSGMCDDGADAVRMVKLHGGRVYAQSAHTCTVDSMPREAEATGSVDFSGSPKQLAQKLASLEHMRVTERAQQAGLST